MRKNVKIILIIILSILCILNGIYNIKLYNENIDLKEKNNKLTNKGKYENGKWIKLDRKKEIPQIIQEIYAWPIKEPDIYVRNWKDDYGYLPKGIYRYIEMACIERKNGNDYITCIFEIKE